MMLVTYVGNEEWIRSVPLNILGDFVTGNWLLRTRQTHVKVEKNLFQVMAVHDQGFFIYFSFLQYIM
jgi:hypothetical protein